MLVKLRKLCIIILLLMLIIMSFLTQKSVIAQPPGWSEDIRLTNALLASGNPSIAVDGNNVYVVWQDARNNVSYDDYEIYFKKSTDNGKTWSEDIRLSNAPHYSDKPKIAVNGSNIHVIWTDDREEGFKIYYNRSEDAGNTWIGEVRISSETTMGHTGYLDIAVNGSNIHVVYGDCSEALNSDFHIYYINSSDNGQTWSPRQRLTSLIRDPNHPSIAINGDNIHIVWMDHRDRFGTGTKGAIFYMISTDGGLTWSEDFNLTPMNLDAAYPDIVTNGDLIHVTFSEEISGIWETHYRRSEDGGISWSEDIQLTDWNRDHCGSSIDVYDVNVSVVWWTSWIQEPDGNGEIYYINSTDNGYSWSENIRLTYDPERAGQADVSVNGQLKHTVWNDRRDGNVEIYYKHYPIPFPPTNLTINIWENNLTLNWTAPQNSPSPVDHYLIYRVTDPDAFTFSDYEIIHNSSGTGNDLLTTWNDTTALLDEANNYYYVVRAIDVDGWNDTNTNIVGKYMIQLKAGWNLFSIPLAQNDTNISEVLKSIDGDYDVVKWYDSKDGVWHSSSNDLTDINRTMGLWTYMNNKCNLSVVGAVPDSTDIAMYEGWNLVGYPSLETRNLSDALSGVNWESVWHYDAFDVYDPWKHNHTSKPYRMNDLEEMKPGFGYWVYVTINNTWIRTRTPDNSVVWVIPGLGEKEGYQRIYEPIIENPIKADKEGNFQDDIPPEELPTSKNDNNEMNFSIVPLIILIVLIFVEVRLLHKRKK